LFFGVFCFSIWMLRLILLFLQRMTLDVWWGLHWIYRLPSVIFTILILLIHEHRRSFDLSSVFEVFPNDPLNFSVICLIIPSLSVLLFLESTPFFFC
jgi:hypothetical protein